jgi:hypothetical protein
MTGIPLIANYSLLVSEHEDAKIAQSTHGLFPESTTFFKELSEAFDGSDSRGSPQLVYPFLAHQEIDRQ